MICEKCGSEMESSIVYSNQIWKCPGCGCEFVTTYIKPIYLDDKKYVLSLLTENTVNKASVTMIKQVSSVTTPQAISLLKAGIPVFYEGDAAHILEMKKRLDAVGIHYAIEPAFLWDNDTTDVLTKPNEE